MATTLQPLYTNKFELNLVQGKAPTERQQVTMEAIAERHQDDENFLYGVPFQNFSCGDGVGPSTGQALLFKPGARVQKVAFGPEVLGITMWSEIHDMVGGLNDQNVAAGIERLNDIVPVYAPVGQALSLACRSPDGKGEMREWSAELGPTGKFGFTKSTDGRQNRYFLVVHASPDLINRELKKWVHDEPMTYKEMLRNPVFNYAREAVKRNAQRIMAHARSEFRLKMAKGVLHDSGAVTAEHDLPINLLTPDEKMYTSTVRPVYHEGEEMVAVYNNVIPAEDCSRQILVDQGPWIGYVMYDTRNAGPVLGFPASTVTKRHPATVAANLGDQSIISERAPFFTWESKQVGTPVTHDDFPSCLLDNVYEAVDKSDHFVDTMKGLGLKKTVPVAKLLPMAMKVPTGREVRLRN